MHRAKEMGSMSPTRETYDHRMWWGYLVLSNKGFHSVDVLRNRILIPLNEGGLGPLDPCQKFF